MAWMQMASSASAQYPTNGLGGATTTASLSMYAPAGPRENSRVRLTGFQPRCSAITASGTVSIDSHAGSAAQIVLSSTAAAAETNLPYVPLNIVLSGAGLKVTASATGIVGILFFEDAT